MNRMGMGFHPFVYNHFKEPLPEASYLHLGQFQLEGC